MQILVRISAFGGMTKFKPQDAGVSFEILTPDSRLRGDDGFGKLAR